MANQIITEALQHVLDLHQEIEQVYFTADGHYHLRAFECGKDLYTRLRQIPEKSPKSGIHTGKFIFAPILDAKGQEDIAFKIVEAVKREDVLAATPVKADTPTQQITKAEILDLLEITPEEFNAILTKRAKK